MANTAGITNSCKQEWMCGHHAMGTSVVRAGTGADTFKMALYMASATLNPGTTAYSASGELSSANYSAGGTAVTNGNQPAVLGGQSTSQTAYWTPSANLTWSTVTIGSPGVDCSLLYNSTQSNKSVCVFTFGATQVTAGNFTLTMPTNDATNGLVRIA